MVLELENQPISIKTLNTRVDTARDLVLKVYNTSLEIVKTASMAENAIVYGNRYRAINSNINKKINNFPNFVYNKNCEEIKHEKK